MRKRNWLHAPRRRPVPTKPSRDFEQVFAAQERPVYNAIVAGLFRSGTAGDIALAEHWKRKGYVWAPKPRVAAVRHQLAYLNGEHDAAKR